MYGILLFIHIGVSILLILAVLMQSGKGGGLSGAFGGGGGNQTAFGGRGAVDFLGKATWILGSAFMVLSLLLAVLASGDGGPSSLIQKSAAPPSAFPPASAPGTGLDSATPPDATPSDVVPAESPATGEPTGGETPADPATPGGN